MGTIVRKNATWICVLFLFAAVIGIVALRLDGQIVWGKDGKKFSKRSKAASEERRGLVNQELAGLKGHPWAGSYYYGDGLGVNVHLSLAPKSGFEFTWNGCLGLYDLNYGDVIERDGRIRLVFTYPNNRKGFEGIAPELVPIVWGGRHYLIPSDGFVGFANAINAGFEPSSSRSMRFLLREGDELKTANGPPKIPAQYSAYLLKHPIKAEISSIKENHFEKSTRVTTVVLNAGSEKGVKPGMEFYLYSPSTIFESARITRVDSSSSEAEVSQDEAYDKSGRPSTAWKLSTSAARNQ